MQDPNAPRFTIDGGTLKITGDLHAAVEADLRKALDELEYQGILEQEAGIDFTSNENGISDQQGICTQVLKPYFQGKGVPMFTGRLWSKVGSYT